MGLFRNLLASNLAMGATDPYFADVVSLLHFDGANASTTITDQIGKVWTALGSSQIVTSVSQFGGASLLSSGGISTPNNIDFDFGSGDFTIEGWVYPTSFAAYRVLCVKRASGSVVAPFCLQLDSASTNKISVRLSSNGTSWAVLFASSISLTANTWAHVALVRSGSTVTLYINGVNAGSSTALGTSALMTNSNSVFIGVDGDATAQWSGNFDDWRFTKGIARYTANFTPPASSFPNS